MPFSIQCPGCNQRLKAGDHLAGRRLPCPKCRQELQVPELLAEDAAAALLLQEDAGDSPPKASPEFTAPVFQPAAPRPSTVPVRTLPPLKSNEPPAWLRHLHWALMLALIPLAVLLLRKDTSEADFIQRLEDSLDNAPIESQIKAERAKDLDDLISALPRERIIGAALGRNTYWHWGFGALAAGLYLGFFVLLATGGVADPRHLIGVGLFTGTVGVFFLLVVQALAEWSQGHLPFGRSILVIFLWIGKLIGLSYRAALDPDNGFLVSFLGFTAGVGLCEELCKAVPVLWHQNRNPDESWRGAFLWGLASGAGFGIAEGIMYSGSMYNGIAGSGLYVVRFVSCVALHALWTGSVAIAAHQRQHWLHESERWLDLVAPALVYIAVPMVLHGLYDTLLKKELTGLALLVALASFGYLAFQISRLHGADDEVAKDELLREYKKRRKAMA